MFVGDLKRPGWPRQIVLFHVPAGGSDLLHVGVAAVRAYRCCRDPGATGAWSRSGVLRLRDCLWEDSGLPSRGNGVLVTQVFWEVNSKGRSFCTFGSRRLKVGARLVLETRSRCM